jgi:serine/threonine-protein kinase
VDPRIGLEFAGHRIEQVVGRGGVSVVYLAEHLRLGRKVALKVLAPHLAEDEAFRERFIRESRMAAALDHPNIVTVYDAGEVEENLYISMRYVDGSDLGRLLRTEGALETSRVILLLSQVASALDAAHGQGLVHRDVKPANVLVESHGGLERAYLADFGISKRTTTGSGLTRTGQFVGTVDYVAPEQITGEPIDGRTDVYSLGCVLFQCVAGRVPFPGDTEVATIYRQLHDGPPTLDGVLEAPEGIDDVIGRALSKSKEDRYATCGSLIEAARTSLTGARDAPTVARPSVPPEAPRPVAEPVTAVLAAPPGGRPSRRRVLWASFAGGALAVLVVVAVVLANVGDEPTGSTGEVTGQTTGSTTGPTGDTGGEPPPLQPTWSWLKEPTPKAGDQAMSDVIAIPDGLVAVGHVEDGLDDAAVWVSRDTNRWRSSDSESLTGPEDQRMLAVTEFDGRVIAGGWEGSQAAMWISDDSGQTWTRSDATLGEGMVRDFAVVDSTLVAVGALGSSPDLTLQDAAVWTSQDGLAWTPVEDASLGGANGQHIWAVHAAGGRLVAVGFTYDGTYDGAIWTSSDAIEWSRIDPAMFDEAGSQLMKGVVGGTGELPLVVVGCEDVSDRCDLESATGSDAAVWISDDGGESWAKVILESEWLVGEGVQAMYAVSRQDSDFIAVGSHTAATGDLDAAVWISSDGLRWVFQRNQAQVRDLGGDPEDQTMRALIPFHRQRLTFVGVGVADDGIDQDAVVWGGF